jgi:E3 SUMO-protein ligase RanBP2
MFNTAYPMYYPQNPQMAGLRPGAQPKIPGITSPLQYPEMTADFLLNQQITQMQNLQMFQNAQAQAQAQAQVQVQQAQGTPQKTPQMVGQPNPQQKSYLLDALTTPSVLNTWNNTYNNMVPPQNQQMQQPIPQMQPQQPQIQQMQPQQPPQVHVPQIPTPVQQLVDKQPPVNVVITSSDPLPAHNTIVTQPTLSVTIPPQHIKQNVQMSAIVQPSIDSVLPKVDLFADPSFKPIIPVLETSVLLENEEEIFSERGKMLYFDKAWKDVGMGTIKVIKNGKDEKARIVMRHDQTLKICVNYQVKPNDNLDWNTTDKTMTWGTPDYIQDGVKVEKLQVKIKNVEIAKKFVSKFEEALKLVGKGKVKEPEKPKITFGTPSKVDAPQPQITFGGSTVTPTLFGLKPKEPEKDAKEPPKQSPFAGFSFGKAPGAENPNKSFTDIFSTLPTNPAPPITAGTVGAPTEEKNRSLSESHEDDYVPTANFEPVIPLPELVEVKTGEENEDVVFEHRAKLLRYDASVKEWKERGIGPMKVLVDKQDPSKARLLMRREQIFKLCCNQLISPDLKFSKLPKSETALSWAGPDFSENEMKTETLAIRFKTAELTQEFHNAVLKVQDAMKKVETKEPPKVEKKKEESKGFGDKFKPKVGSWNCEACYINNKAEELYCVACDSPKDSTVPKKEPKGLLDNLASSGSKFSFGMPAADTTATAKSEPQKFSFGSSGGFSFGTPTTTSSDSSGFSFSNTLVTTAAADSTKPATGFTFGSGSFSFGAATESTPAVAPSFSFNTPTKAEPEKKKEEEVKNPFDNAAKKDSTFNFVFKPKSPSAKSPGRSANNSISEDHQSDNEYHVEEENQAYFTPAIPLPDKVEVKTGEEDEDALYSHRAKLFRFTDGEWKERGLGDVKVLKHRVTGKLR